MCWTVGRAGLLLLFRFLVLGMELHVKMWD